MKSRNKKKQKISAWEFLHIQNMMREIEKKSLKEFVHFFLLLNCTYAFTHWFERPLSVHDTENVSNSHIFSLKLCFYYPEKKEKEKIFSYDIRRASCNWVVYDSTSTSFISRCKKLLNSFLLLRIKKNYNKYFLIQNLKFFKSFQI